VAIDQTGVIDFVTVTADEAWLTISDHLPWDEDEGEHLQLLQDKLNAYLRFIESGELIETCPSAIGHLPVINLVGKFPLSPLAQQFVHLAEGTVQQAGFRLQFSLIQPN